MFYPSLVEFKKISKKHNIVPVYREIIADCKTTVSTFIKLTSKEDYAYLLESVEGGERWGRYSFISWGPKFIFECSGNRYNFFNPRTGRYLVKDKPSTNPLYELKEFMKHYKPANLPGLPRFWGGAVGYISYEMIHNFEAIPRVNSNKLNLPDGIFLLNDVIIIFDHLTHKTKVVVCVDIQEKFKKNIEKKYLSACKKIGRIISFLEKSSLSEVKKKIRNRKTNSFKSNIKRQDFLGKVKKAKEYIRSGDIIQVVLSQRFKKQTFAAPFDIYRVLRMINPSPYMYYLKFKNFELIGSSPEILVRKDGDTAEVRPIAGTRPRGKDELQEKKYENELLKSHKERAEHIMLVDLGRNDLGRVCKYNSISVPEFMIIERYSHVIHIVSSVVGKLKNGISAFDLFRACFPAGTVSGAPKVRAMEIISELEPSTRGPYAGAVGYFCYSGNMDMAINIRTILYKDGVAYVQAGAGIVADSVPASEYQETRNKAQALFLAVEQAEKQNI
jgi:anthranilate synthase component 1